jgi:hypothetical protein
MLPRGPWKELRMPDLPAIARRRRAYKPEKVCVLLIGESAPAGGTHFYLANSNLFRGVRGAFARIYGRSVPDGDAFLLFFQRRGYWLIDLADEPVNRLDDQPRRQLVENGVRRVSKTIRESQPAVVVVVKKSIERQVRTALALSGQEADLIALPFPAMGWQSAFVEGLARVIRRARRAEERQQV